jgi:hypothetical protein
LVFDFRSQFGLWEPLDGLQRQLPPTTCQIGQTPVLRKFVRSL